MTLFLLSSEIVTTIWEQTEGKITDYFLGILMLGECVISSVLSHHSNNLNGGPVLQLGYSSVLLGKQKKVHPPGVRAG